MDLEDFKDIRHRYYRLGKGRIEILRRMGYQIGEKTLANMDHASEKLWLMQVWEDVRVDELIDLIKEMENAQISK